MKHVHRSLFVLLILVPTTLLGATIPGGSSTIAEVTVYLNGAEIVRETPITIPRGSSTIEFADFPAGIRAPSIRASVEGVPAIVRSIEMADADETEKTETDLDRKITEVEDQIFALDLTRTDDKALRGYLEAAASTRAKNDGASDTGADPANISAVYEVLEQRFEGLLKDRLAQRKLRRDLERQLIEARKVRNEKEDAVPTRIARFAVEAKASGQATLVIRYFVWEAAWEPNYGGTLGDDGNLELVAEAAIKQWTQEDWSNVRLKLSTVAASRSLSAPYLGPWKIKPWQPRQEEKALQDALTELESGQQSNFVAVPEVDEIVMEMPASRSLTTTSTETSYSVTFDVPGRVSVEASGPPQQFTIWEETLASTVAYRVKPALEATAYLEATVLAPASVPLLAGELALYTSNTLIGAHELPETGPGETRIIPFGSDPRIKIERVTRDISAGRQGAIRRQAREERAYRTKITNHRNEAVRVVVEDRLPVADDERIVVALSNETTPGHKPSSNRRGVLLWELNLAAGETGEIDFGYTVRYPLDMEVEGLE